MSMKTTQYDMDEFREDMKVSSFEDALGSERNEGLRSHPQSKQFKESIEQSHNKDGSKTDFYNIPEWVKDADDLAEYLELNFYLGNVLKTLWCNKGKRHDGTNKPREDKKRLHYSRKEAERDIR